MTKKPLILLALVAALLVTGCGSDSKDASTSAAAGNGVDRAFVAAMIPHHQSAVAMANIAASRGQSPFVKTLAANIIRTQTAEISQMRAEDAKLADAGVSKGDLGASMDMMGMNMDTGMLKTANPFDPAFLNMMIPHHEAAVTMAKAEISKGNDPTLQQLAKNIITAQQTEIAEMKAQQS